MSDTDLVPASILYAGPGGGRRAETWTVKASPAHRWYFKHGQRPDEVVLIKCFDSDGAVPARRTPHSAVEDPSSRSGGGGEAECRESVEVGCLVFY